MARKILTPLDMTLNELRNVLAHVLASDPVSPVESQFWYNSTDNVMRYYDGTSVIDITTGGAVAASAVSVDSTDLAGTGTDAQTVLEELEDAIDTKAPIASPTFTGNPAAPTPTLGDNDTSIATTAFVQAAIAALVDSAPGTLDTLNELAAAINDDAAFSATVVAALATKAAKYGTLIGDGVTTAIAVTHSLGTRDVIVSVHDASTFEEVECDVTKTSTSVVTLGFAVAPASNAYRVTVHG